MNKKNRACMIFVCASLFSAIIVQAADTPTAKPSSSQALSPEEAAICIGGYLWQLDVSVPPKTKMVQATFEVERPRKLAEGFAGGVKATPLTAKTPLHLLVAVVPLGRDIRECEEIRVTVIGFGGWGSTVEKNPFRGSRGVGKPAAPESAGNGKYHLMGSFNAGDTLPSPMSGCDQVLTLHISTE